MSWASKFKGRSNKSAPWYQAHFGQFSCFYLSAPCFAPVLLGFELFCPLARHLQDTGLELRDRFLVLNQPLMIPNYQCPVFSPVKWHLGWSTSETVDWFCHQVEMATSYSLPRRNEGLAGNSIDHLVYMGAERWSSGVRPKHLLPMTSHVDSVCACACVCRREVCHICARLFLKYLFCWFVSLSSCQYYSVLIFIAWISLETR